MIKYVNKAIILFSLAGSFSYAGVMGATEAQSSFYAVSPYVSLEASATWNQVSRIKLNNQITHSGTTQPWGGRFAAGLMFQNASPFALVAEVGGGYYGSKSVNYPVIAYSGRVTIDGYDVLVGGAYHVTAPLTLLGKVGFMGQNLRAKKASTSSGFISGTTTYYFARTEILPEIKVGGMYHLYQNIDFTIAYLHVFGETMYNNLTINASSSGISTNGESNTGNPSLDSVMFGVLYHFA